MWFCRAMLFAIFISLVEIALGQTQPKRVIVSTQNERGSGIGDLVEVSLAERNDIVVLNRDWLRAQLVEKVTGGRYHALMSAEYVVSLIVSEAGERRYWRVSGEVIEVGTGKICSSFSERFHSSSLLAGAERISSLVHVCNRSTLEGDDGQYGLSEEFRLEQSRGILYVLLGENELAIGALRAALEIEPMSFNTRCWLSRAYLNSGRLTEAAIENKKIPKNFSQGSVCSQ